MILNHHRLCHNPKKKNPGTSRKHATMHAVLKGHQSLSFQKSLLNDTTWGSQAVIAIETSNAHCYRNFEWPQENWGKGEKSNMEYNFTI